jgi:hypothetical protein
MIICGKEISDEVVDEIRCIISTEPDVSRVQLSRRVCEHFGWRSPNGRLKEVSCRVALLKLHRGGRLTLPKIKQPPPGKLVKSDYSSSLAEEEATVVQGGLSDLGEIGIVRIRSADSVLSRQWNELMNRYHYLGAGPLCGAQMRYLLKSSRYGLLGGFAFSAAAWRVAARDRWIGWDKTDQEKNLHHVICNSRFLICPYIQVPHLASHALSLMIKQIGKDWNERYGVIPMLIETYIDRSRFKGTCYKAANWFYAGATKGRGRQDRSTARSVSIKDVYLYPLRQDVRKVLCNNPPQPFTPASQSTDWAEEEFGGAQLGDQRLVKRLVTMGRDFYAQPQANVPQACESRAKTKAAYRFLDNPETTMDKILAAHYASTMNRIGKESVVLAVQDTTSLNYSTHPATENLGLISQHTDGVMGLLVHDTMAFNLHGTPLGLLNVQCWARDPQDYGKSHLRKRLPVEQKESNKWLRSFRAVIDAQQRYPKAKLVSVGDREADMYELFELALSNPSHPKLLVRAQRDRLLADGQEHLWDYVAAQPVCGIEEIQIPRRGNQKARQARLTVKFAQVRLNPPYRKELSELTVWAVIAEEIDAPQGIEPLKWMLLTTLEVSTFEAASETLEWYCLRWGIEIFHRTLKSGCKLENRQLGSADRIEACLAIDMVVAWRIFNLTKSGRETPNSPCTVFFENAEWKALVAYKTQNALPPENPPSLREAVHMVASLGGFLGRKCDGEPGTQTIWMGLQRLDDITLGWKVAIQTFAPHLLSPPVSSGKYG